MLVVRQVQPALVVRLQPVGREAAVPRELHRLRPLLVVTSSRSNTAIDRFVMRFFSRRQKIVSPVKSQLPDCRSTKRWRPA